MLKLAPLFNYHRHVANNNFAQAMAKLPKSQWASTSKRRWICARLGIYSPILNAGWRGYGLRSGVAYAEALSAYGRIQECQTVIDKLLTRPGINRYKFELIHELSKYNPSFAIQVIDSLPRTKQTILQLALKSAIQYKQISLHSKNTLITKPDADYLKLRQLIIANYHQHPDLILLDCNWQASSANQKLECFNQYLVRFNLPPTILKSSQTSFNSLNIQVAAPIRQHPLSICSTSSIFSTSQRANTVNTNDILDNLDTKVSIIVTVYNAQHYIASTLYSLLNQSWRNIEVILIDDASTDASLNIAQAIAQQDQRLTVLSQSTNQGTYVAKNRAIRHICGSFVVCHDSDDWAHPLKIEKQVLPLLLDTGLMATTSSWVKIDLLGNFVSRMGYPYKRKNPSSLLFRTQALAKLTETCHTGKNENGYIWQPVRTGADSELFERYKLIFGKESIRHIDVPLTLGGHHENSLMNARKTGTQSLTARIKRLEYWEAWRRQHIAMLNTGKI